MNRLVINELYKVFSKKGIYVLGFITLCMIVINTIICKLNNIGADIRIERVDDDE
jgi:hypothetical protein